MRSTRTAAGLSVLLSACGSRTGAFEEGRATSASGGVPSVASGGAPTVSAAGSGGEDARLATPCRARDLGNALGFPIAEGVLAGGSASATHCGGTGPEAWFRWTAPFSGLFRFAATGDGRALIVSAYDEAMGCRRLSLIACQSSEPVMLPLARDESVLLSVDTNEAGGGFVLDAWGDPGRAGTGCADVDVGDLTGVVRVGSFTGSHLLWPFSCTRDDVTAVVTSWTAPRAGYYVFDTTGSSVDTLLEVRAGCDAETLGCSDDYAGSAARLELFFELGGTAAIAVGEKGGSSQGHYTLAITAP